MVTVFFWIVLCVVGYNLPKNGIYEFYGLAVLVGFVMGGIQSLSRSTYAKLMPETKDTTSFFSFYDVTEKIAIVIGMFSFGYINEFTGSQRNSVLALVVFFILGLIILYSAAVTQKRQKNHAAI
jgi:UMF1 family MFS transporter